MHQGCDGVIDTGKQVLDKVRRFGFSNDKMPVVHTIECECGNTFEMTTFETKCDGCGMVYGVTPCSVKNPEAIKKAGINY